MKLSSIFIENWVKIQLDGDKRPTKQIIVLRKQGRHQFRVDCGPLKADYAGCMQQGVYPCQLWKVWAGELEWLLCWSVKSEDSTSAFISTSTTAPALYNWQSLPTGSLPAIRVLTFGSLYNKTAEQF